MGTVSPDLVEKHLKVDGFAAIDFALGQQDHDDLFEAFGDVIAAIQERDGQQIAEALTFQLKGRETDGDYYLVKRTPGDRHPFHPERAPGTEHKVTAHIGPLSLERSIDYFGRGNVPRDLGRLLALSAQVHNETKAALRPVYEALGIDHLMLSDDPRLDVHIVRLLRYLHTDKEKPKASLHFDRSVATLAVTESKKGLIGAPGNNNFYTPLTIGEADDMAALAFNRPIDHAVHEAKFFLGAGYNHLRQEHPKDVPRLPLFLHGVDNEEPDVERDAAVVFMNPHVEVPYTVPGSGETGIDEIREEILRHRPPYIDD